MINDFHPEIQTWIKSKCLQANDPVSFKGESCEFVKLPKITYGRLGSPGLAPGVYVDRENAFIDNGESLKKVKISELSIDPDLLQVRIDELPEDYYLISRSPDKEGELPETEIIESDVVKLVDKNHEHYPDETDHGCFLSANQFTVNRIDYDKDPIEYKLKSGSTVFRVTSDQIERCGDGPVRLFYGGEGYKLRWPSIKEEAEFFCLLGRYLRAYNPINKSYYWDLNQAQQLITLGKAHGVLQTEQGYCLITFWDQQVGHALSYYPDILLDI